VTVEEVDEALRLLINNYIAIAVNDKPPHDLGAEHSLDVYESFHLLERTTICGTVPLQCTCVQYGTLFASIFVLESNLDLQAPSDYVAAEPSLRKKSHKIKGTVGPKCQRLLQAA
jgi:hypothetical protein